MHPRGCARRARSVSSTFAAGDAFAGVFASSLDAGTEVIEALRRASIAGGLACTATGAQPSLPTGAEIAARLAELPNPSRL